MTTVHYKEIDGLVCGDLVARDGVDPSASGLKLSDHPLASRDFAVVVSQGRGSSKYKLQALSQDRDDLEYFIKKCNRAKRDAEFYPFLADRALYIEKAWAAEAKHTGAFSPTTGYHDYLYRAEAEITCRAPWRVGADQGQDYTANPALPFATASLTNGGNRPAGLDYLRASGGYSGGYTTGLLYRFAGANYNRDITLCDELLVGDKFCLNMWGEIEHSYRTKFYETYTVQQRNMLGATYCNYGAGGSCAFEDFRMGAGGILAMASYGPPPVSGEYPTVEFNATLVGGNIEIVRAFVYDLTDAEVIDCDTIQAGYNKIEVPGCSGEDLCIIGIRVPVGGSLRLSEVEFTVPRYTAKSRLPEAEVGEAFALSLRDGASSNHTLDSATIYYRDQFEG